MVDKEKLDTLYAYGQKLMNSIEDDYKKDMDDKAEVERKLKLQKNLISEIEKKLLSLEEDE